MGIRRVSAHDEAERNDGVLPRGSYRQSAPRELLKRFPMRKIDKPLLFAALALGVFGILMIYSATRADTPVDVLPEAAAHVSSSSAWW